MRDRTPRGDGAEGAAHAGRHAPPQEARPLMVTAVEVTVLLWPLGIAVLAWRVVRAALG